MKWFYNLKISAKLLIGFIAIALIAGVIGITGIINITTLKNADAGMYNESVKGLVAMEKVLEGYQRNRVNVRDLVNDTTQSEIDNRLKLIKERDVLISEGLAAVDIIAQSPEERALYEALVKAVNEWAPFREKAISLAVEGKDAEGIAFMRSPELTKAAAAYDNAISAMYAQQVDFADQTVKSNAVTANSSITLMTIFVVAGMLLAIGLGIFISRIISKPLNELVQVAGKISNGDLDVNIEVKSRDEIGILTHAFDTMAGNINNVMTDINSASEQVASGSKQVSDSSMALSQGATEQASSIEQLTASLEEISSQTKLNAQNANQANELAETARINAVQGNTQMKEMLKAMEEINDSSASISKIIKVIDEIAFQTNILALNAAVEAARAGQHGKGFAVVAEEVRNLAARSANAAKETTDMIEGSIKKVEGGTKIANETATALNKIVDGVAKAAALVSDIAVASNEQASGIAQINQGIMQVSQVVQTNSATSQESAAASEELSSQAELLKESVSKFKLKKTSQSYGKLGEFNPEVLKMLEDMSDRKKGNSRHTEYKPATTHSKTKIALSDNEFGKY